jgi:serine/threonine protein kinase
MAVVYEAEHFPLKRRVALKFLRGDVSETAEGYNRFRAEAEAVARLQHPNVVQIHEVGEADGRPYLALDYVDGGSLAARLAQAPLTPRSAAALVEALAGAVHAAHLTGVVHRDLKPANVLLAGGGEQDSVTRGPDEPLPTPDPSLLTPKVTDFGLAKRLEGDSDLTRTGAVLGTPAYMAPEQAAGRPAAVGPAADVYALGAILYECLTGRPPFRGATALETLEQVRSRDPLPRRALRPGVPRDLETVCLKCLHKAPHRRYGSAADLADDLRRFLDGRPVQARPVGVCERAVKAARRRPAAAALAGVVVLAAAGGAAGLLAHNARLRDALTLVTAREGEARRQKERADENYTAARETIRDAAGDVQQLGAAGGEAETPRRGAGEVRPGGGDP